MKKDLIHTIPQTDPKAGYLAHKAEIDKAVSHVLNSGRYIQGQELAKFEKEFADYINIQHAVGVASGTDALQLALRVLGIGPGDQVITVSHTAVATVAAIELCGATPILVDIDLNTYTIDPDRVESAITPHTKAIIPVHLYGHPADMESIMKVANRYQLWVVEDCAQSHGATYKGRMTGTWGHIGAFSFYPTKNLGAIGDGGMLLTNDQGLAKKARSLREYGWHQRYISEVPGLNSRLDELQAAILRVKLRYLDEENRKRQIVADIYNEKFVATNLAIPIYVQGAKHVYHQYAIRLKHRNSLKEFLRKKGIGALIHYPVPVHRQPAYQDRMLIGAGSMEHTEQVCRDILSLPMYPQMPAEDARQVGDLIVNWYNLMVKED